jgi:hypothetical protein
MFFKKLCRNFANAITWNSLALFTFLGFLVSFLIPETMGMTLEQLAKGERRESHPFLKRFKFWEFRARKDTGARDPAANHNGTANGGRTRQMRNGLTMDESELNRIPNGEATAPQQNIGPHDPGRQQPDQLAVSGA